MAHGIQPRHLSEHLSPQGAEPGAKTVPTGRSRDSGHLLSWGTLSWEMLSQEPAQRARGDPGAWGVPAGAAGGGGGLKGWEGPTLEQEQEELVRLCVGKAAGPWGGGGTAGAGDG